MTTPRDPILTVQPPAEDEPSKLVVNTVSVLIGAVGTALAALAALAAAPTVTVARVLLLVVLAAAVGPIVLTDRTPRRFRTRIVLAAAVAGVVAFAAGIALLKPTALIPPPKIVVSASPVISVVASPSPVLPTVPPKPDDITVIAPPPGSTAPLAGCFLVKFKATPPAGYGFAVGSRITSVPGGGSPDDRYYFEGDVHLDEATDIRTAQVEVSDPGVTADIVIVLVPDPTLTYLAGSRDEDGATWWSQTSIPPLSVAVTAFPIQRTKATGGC